MKNQKKRPPPEEGQIVDAQVVSRASVTPPERPIALAARHPTRLQRKRRPAATRSGPCLACGRVGTIEMRRGRLMVFGCDYCAGRVTDGVQALGAAARFANWLTALLGDK